MNIAETFQENRQKPIYFGPIRGPKMWPTGAIFHSYKLFEKMAKNLQKYYFLPTFVIKDPLKSEAKIKILLPYLLGQYCCAHSRQILE